MLSDKIEVRVKQKDLFRLEIIKMCNWLKESLTPKMTFEKQLHSVPEKLLKDLVSSPGEYSMIIAS